MYENKAVLNAKDNSYLNLAVWTYYRDPLSEKETEKETISRLNSHKMIAKTNSYSQTPIFEHDIFASKTFQ